jgi:hypothetical protein
VGSTSEVPNLLVNKEAAVTGEKHRDTSHAWLYFFFICFGLIQLGIVIFFARNVNDQPQPSSGGGHSIILPADVDCHGYRLLTS